MTRRNRHVRKVQIERATAENHTNELMVRARACEPIMTAFRVVIAAAPIETPARMRGQSAAASIVRLRTYRAQSECAQQLLHLLIGPRSIARARAAPPPSGRAAVIV